ncbi:patatin-like phospholipase family protein [Pelagibius sp. CAU 1746]|uniref:patatin-like phospholipase family protein n=1 Tax=Pelagibius sp. CAU 1746 TaxID=3140370 RepID=UPI00325AC848
MVGRTFSASLFVLFLAGSSLLQGCAAPARLPAVPEDRQSAAAVAGMPGIRYWQEADIPMLIEDGKQSYYRELDLWQASGQQGELPPASYLAVSGGGEDGAFGAGLLVGWSEAGTRPEFKLVTGISTGALTAPFAFLGSSYDKQLKDVYTTISARDVLVERGLAALIFDDALSDNAPLRKLIARYFDETMLRAIAEEHAKGRVLLIGTTNIDARRPVVWNITKIAASGHPGALDLIHDVLVASAAIPAAFPPTMIDVEVDGQSYQEMHVDGGASAQVFVYPGALHVKDVSQEEKVQRERRAYIIRNGRLDPQWAETDRVTYSIGSRAISSLIQNQGVGDLYRIYTLAQRDGVDFNLAFIPPTFDVPLNEPFDQAYMKALYDLGYEIGKSGTVWAKEPPGY